MKKNTVTEKTEKPLTKSTNQFPVVGIGASAGGLDAFKKLLKAIPEDSGMAYVLVQHLDPKHESLLPELLQKVTSIPVLEITDDIKVKPNHIYIIPSNKIMIADDGVLKLTVRPSQSNGKLNLPIDLFFTSLAEVHQSHSIGVVLSGTGSDGTNGLKAIKDQGGLTFAQDQASAAFDGMPLSAVLAGVVDFILPPNEILQKIVEVTNIINKNGNDKTHRSPAKTDEDVFRQIISLIRIRKETDFTYYKKSTIYRRILRRMALNKNEKPANYLKYLKENQEELDILYQDFLIPVTEFFRDKKSFDHLSDIIFPQIIKNKTKNEPVRIWVAACSTGEEAFSMAICLKEYLGEQNQQVQIFATDLSESAIASARKGIYDKSTLERLSPKRIINFFTKRNGNYQVNKNIRDMCVFAHHDFLQDPPFGKMDLISCRNVLIYMEPYLQKKALTTFHYALNLKGFLLLGKTETINSVPDLFVSIVRGDKIFSRKDVPAKFMQVTTQRSEQTLHDNRESMEAIPISTDFQKAADEIVLKKYMPAGVVVNDIFDIVSYRGRTIDYLEQLSGKPSQNILKLAKKELAFELRSIIHKAKQENEPVIKENISLIEYLPKGQKGSSRRNVSIEAIPLNTVEPHFLILFHEINNQKSKKSKSTESSEKDEKDIRIQQLEQQLLQTHEDMISITEEQETANEELQTGNEELLSSSEELQSLNEELETSKEELQSTNEELMVVNQEMTSLAEQVTEARDYAEAIVSTVHSALLVLDQHLRVKSANRSFYKLFAVTEKETEGVYLFDLGNKQWNIPRLREFLLEIVPKNAKFHGLEVSHIFPDIGEKIMLLNASRIHQKNNKEELILLSIKDVTEEVIARKKVEESENRFHKLIFSSPAAICILKGKDLVITSANEPILKIWGKDETSIGKQFFEELPELVEQGFSEIFAHVYQSGTPFNATEMPIRFLQNGEGTLNYYNFVIYPQHNFNNEIEGIGIIAFEVSSEALKNLSIKKSEEQFRTLTQTLPQLIWVSDEQGKLEFASSRWKEYSGIEQIEEEDLRAIIHPEDYKQAHDPWLQSLSVGLTYTAELRLKNRNGIYRWYISKAEPIFDEEKKIIKWVGALTDIDDQKIKEEKKDEFISIASHEMKTPLTIAKAYLQMLALSLNNSDEKIKVYVKKASQSVDRLDELISELLDVSKIRLGKLNYTITTFDFNEMIENTVESIRLTSETHQIIKTGKVKDKITGDKERLQQVIINLLSNAIKYSPFAEKVYIKIAQEKDKIKVSVKDTGIGIAQQSLDKVFDKYHRVDEQAGQFQGLGIGLFISFEIIQRHHGELWAESEEGKGSTFYFTLPLNNSVLPQ